MNRENETALYGVVILMAMNMLLIGVQLLWTKDVRSDLARMRIAISNYQAVGRGYANTK